MEDKILDKDMEKDILKAKRQQFNEIRVRKHMYATDPLMRYAVDLARTACPYFAEQWESQMLTFFELKKELNL